MKCLDEKAYVDWKANNVDPYGSEIFRFAEAWADLMEQEIALGKQIPDIAEETSKKADTSGITGYMYGAAVNVLALCWEHGEPLRKWHNHEYGHDGAGVVNPAILVIGKKGE